ncbi:unnamed protein product [Pseudo-nitzschia multistriata]|uniref:Uncharacterized protein n=1 Tax=Pseudo-nitzschia multistriata TaxID=183589 RepID=A0A448YV79_9STRA|nr:unnamed protein product [Pseudo-nitzschia multistriata]
MVALEGFKDVLPGLLGRPQAKEVLGVPLRLVHREDGLSKGVVRIGGAPVLSLARPDHAVLRGPNPDEPGGLPLRGPGVPPVVALEGVLLGEFRVGPAGGLLQEEVADGTQCCRCRTAARKTPGDRPLPGVDPVDAQKGVHGGGVVPGHVPTDHVVPLRKADGMEAPPQLRVRRDPRCKGVHRGVHVQKVAVGRVLGLCVAGGHAGHVDAPQQARRVLADPDHPVVEARVPHAVGKDHRELGRVPLVFRERSPGIPDGLPHQPPVRPCKGGQLRSDRFRVLFEAVQHGAERGVRAVEVLPVLSFVKGAGATPRGCVGRNRCRYPRDKR